MPILDLIKVHTPRMGIYQRAFSTEFRIYGRDELQSIDRRYSHCSNATMGALYDRHGDLIEMSQRDGGRNGDLVAEIDPPRVIDRKGFADLRFQPGRTLYLGQYMNLYGHFLVETMSRFWGIATGAFDQVAFFPFAAHRGEIMTYDFHRIILEHFDITPDRTIILRTPMEFEEIHVPERLCTINFCANIEMPSVYRGLSEHYGKGTGNSRIFLSRLQPYSRIDNVTEVEEVFRELDFEIVYPERLDLPSQIGLYAGCRVMAGFAGSALHNCLFCQAGTALIELGDTRSRTQPLSTQSVVNQASGVEATFIPYEGSPEGRMDTANLRERLLEASLLARRRTPPQVGADFESRGLVIHYPWPATMTLHVGNVGDVKRVGSLLLDALKDGQGGIEGFSIRLDDTAPFGIEYKVLLNDRTWTEWSGPGVFLGSRALSKSIRGYAVRLVGPGAGRFRCTCLGKFAGQERIVEAADRDECKSKNTNLLLGIQIQLQPA